MYTKVYICLKYIFKQVAPPSYNWQSVCIESGNDVAPNRLQSIVWTYETLLYLRMLTLFGRVSVTGVGKSKRYCNHRITYWSPNMWNIWFNIQHK